MAIAPPPHQIHFSPLPQMFPLCGKLGHAPTLDPYAFLLFTQNSHCLPRRAALGPSAWRRHTQLGPCVWSGNGSQGPHSPEGPQPWRWGLGKEQKGVTAPSTQAGDPSLPPPPAPNSYSCIPHQHTASVQPVWAWRGPQHYILGRQTAR